MLDGSEPGPQSRKYIGPIKTEQTTTLKAAGFVNGQPATRVAGETPPLFNGDKTWGLDISIPPGARTIALVVEDVGSRITDRHGHGNWRNAGFITG